MTKSKKDELKVLEGAEVIGYIRIPKFARFKEGEQMGGFEQRLLLFRNPDLILSIVPQGGKADQLFYENDFFYHSVQLESPQELLNDLQETREDWAYEKSPRFKRHYERYFKKILSFYGLEKEMEKLK